MKITYSLPVSTIPVTGFCPDRLVRVNRTVPGPGRRYYYAAVARLGTKMIHAPERLRGYLSTQPERRRRLTLQVCSSNLN